ncbi:MAG: hypothetical protein RL088_2534 [Verrucomicrobiota bacterium]|jgi:hypothetical protein
MQFAAAIITALAILVAPLCAQSPAPARRSSPPRLLLDTPDSWRVQSGTWKPADGTVTGTAGETLSEYAAVSAMPLKGRWLSLRMEISGDSAKAGLWFAGLRDDKSELVRLTLDTTSGNITNGRGRTIATLPAGTLGKPVDLLLNFSANAMRLRVNNEQVAELAITYDEPHITPSLFVERGTTVFSTMVLGIDEAAPLTAPAAPPKVIAKPIATLGLSADFTPEKMTAIKDGWRDYFGMQSVSAAGPWKTVRQFDGPATSLPSKAPAGGQVLAGPFNGTPVEMDLSWFRDPLRRTSLGLDRNLPVILGADLTAIYVAPWRSMLGKLQQDQIWALMKLAYGSDPKTEKRLLFQWGDDINSQRLGTDTDARTIKATPRNGLGYVRNSNQPADAASYAENYFAPAVEAVRAASRSVFGDERSIPVLIGSCARAGLEANRDWFRSVLEHTIEGELAPTLKGRKVIDLVDYLTVNHPFADAPDTKSLQALWNTYGKRVKGLWVTEEFGNIGHSPAQVINRAALFLEWVSANDLDSQQTRLIWNFASRNAFKDDSTELARRLAETMTENLRFAMDTKDFGTLYRVASGENKLLLLYTPTSERKQMRATKTGDISIEVGEDRAKAPWVARFLVNSSRRAVDEVIPIRKEGTRLVITPNTIGIGSWAILIETP